MAGELKKTLSFAAFHWFCMVRFLFVSEHKSDGLALVKANGAVLSVHVAAEPCNETECWVLFHLAF